MSWLEKSAGIVMSEIILGNAGVCCKVPGKRQFITSVGQSHSPLMYTQTRPPSQPPCAGGGQMPYCKLGTMLSVAGDLT